MNVYLDASFLVSLYSADANSSTAARTVQSSAGRLLVTSLAELEVINAFELRVFRKEITAQQATTSLQDFAVDLRAGVFQQYAIPEGSFLHARGYLALSLRSWERAVPTCCTLRRRLSSVVIGCTASMTGRESLLRL